MFDRNAVSRQCGAATLLRHLHQKGHVALTLDWVGEAGAVEMLETMRRVQEVRATLDRALQDADPATEVAGADDTPQG